ncbi:MAG: hypothetical protein ABSC55_25960 [Syntrophorhabdales bacterium]
MFINTAESLDELAKKCGIDAKGLKRSMTATLGPFVTLRKWTIVQAPSYKRDFFVPSFHASLQMEINVLSEPLSLCRILKTVRYCAMRVVE